MTSAPILIDEIRARISPRLVNLLIVDGIRTLDQVAERTATDLLRLRHLYSQSSVLKSRHAKLEAEMTARLSRSRKRLDATDAAGATLLTEIGDVGAADWKARAAGDTTLHHGA
jgi:hypothetical protein